MDTALSPLQHPAWTALGWLIHGFSTRGGGLSTVYARDGGGDLNLGFTAADERETVLRNREFLLAHLLGETRGDRPALTTLSQVHSNTVHTIDGPEAPPAGDGMITRTPGVYLGILTADCVPVLVADTRKRAVGAFHAGWRGTVARIVEGGVEKMRREFACRPEDLSALIGPCIGSCCYGVGEELRDRFDTEFAYGRELFPAQLHLDLVEANRRQLLDAGLAPGSVHRIGGCTSCGADLYFSHRRDRGQTGRMMAVAGIRPSAI